MNLVVVDFSRYSKLIWAMLQLQFQKPPSSSVKMTSQIAAQELLPVRVTGGLGSARVSKVRKRKRLNDLEICIRSWRAACHIGPI
jgi:hypothetical protein